MNKESRDCPKDGATRQKQWREREASKGRTRRFDRKVTQDEYTALSDLLKRIRES